MKTRIKAMLPPRILSAYYRTLIVIFNLLNMASPTFATKMIHFHRTKTWPDLENPKDFNEKLQWLKLNEDQDARAVCADKYAVYDYVRNNHDPSILNRLIAVYDDPSQIKWDDLPRKFAMKCTHGSGSNIITTNKDELDKHDVEKKLRKWLGQKYGRMSLEPHYDLIQPRIIVEEYIETDAGLLPLDYKIYCFNGLAKLVLVCSERENGLKLDFFDMEWRRLAIGHKQDQSTTEIAKPACFEQMVAHAEALSKPFTFVRIDFYDKDGSPVFGEMTFTPAANMAIYYNEYGLELLGNMLELPSH